MKTISTDHDCRRHIAQGLLAFAASFPETAAARFNTASQASVVWFHGQCAGDERTICVYELNLTFHNPGNAPTTLVFILGAFRIFDGTPRFSGAVSTKDFSETFRHRLSAFGSELIHWFLQFVPPTKTPTILVEPEEIEHSRTIASVYLQGVGDMTLGGTRRKLVATVHGYENSNELRYLAEITPEQRAQVMGAVQTYRIAKTANCIPVTFRLSDMKVLRREHGHDEVVGVVLEEDGRQVCLVSLGSRGGELGEILAAAREALSPSRVDYRHADLRVFGS